MTKQASKVIDGREVVVTIIDVDVNRRASCAGPCLGRIKGEALLIKTGCFVRVWCFRCAPPWARKMVGLR